MAIDRPARNRLLKLLLSVSWTAHPLLQYHTFSFVLQPSRTSVDEIEVELHYAPEAHSKMDMPALNNDGMLYEAAVPVVCELDAVRPKAVEEQHTPLSSASATSQEPVPSPVLADDAPGGKSPESLEAEALPDTHCRETGLNHMSLVKFGIPKCPKCNDILQSDSMATPQASRPSSNAAGPVEAEAMVHPDKSQEVLDLFQKLNRGIESMALVGEYWRKEHGEAKAKAEEAEESEKGESEEEDSEDESDESEHQHQLTVDNFAHQVEYRDEGDSLLAREWRNSPLGIDEVRQGQDGGAVAIITNVVKTNIPYEGYRTPLEKEKVLKAGIFHNPNVEIVSFRQTLHLKSVPLLKVLESVVTYYPGLNLQGKRLSLDAPFHALAHHMPELEKFRDTFVPKAEVTTTTSLQENDDDVTTLNSGSLIQNTAEYEHSEVALKHVDKILNFMRTDNIYSQQLQEELVRHKRDPPLCTFSMLWLLYKPGTTVYISSSAGIEALVVSEVQANTPNPDGLNFSMEPTTTTLMLWNLGFDGTFVRRQKWVEVIGSFDGERPIADLRVVPVEFADKADGGQIRGRLVELGRKWFGLLRGAPQQYYMGETMGLGRKKVSDVKLPRSLFVTKITSIDLETSSTAGLSLITTRTLRRRLITLSTLTENDRADTRSTTWGRILSNAHAINVR